MKIRKAKKEDYEDVAKIMMVESAKKPYEEKYTLKKALKEVAEFSKGEFYVAVDDKKMSGFIASGVVSNNDKKAYIYELWVRADRHRKGIGKALLGFIEEIYKRKRFSIIRLSTRKDAIGFNFYKKMKYRENKKLIYMEKKL